MRLSRTAKVSYGVMLACVAVAGLATFIAHATVSSPAPLWGIHIFTFVCYTTFFLAWLRLALYRLVDRRIRTFMAAVVCVMMGWMLARTVRFELTGYLPVFSRYLWYTYYIGHTFVPTLLYLSVRHIGLRPDEGIDHRFWLLLGGAAAVCVVVFTNDLHQLVFRFPESADLAQVSGDGSYTLGPLYFLPWAWVAVLACAGLAHATRKFVRARAHRAAPLAPLGVLIIGLTQVGLYNALPWLSDATPFKSTERTCILVVAFMESLVVSECFPVNERYGSLSRASSLRVSLVDRQGVVAYQTERAPEVSLEQVREALEHPVALVDDDVLVARPIRGGYACWVRDLGRVRLLEVQLEEIGDALSEQNAMLAAENELAHEREALSQRQALYDSIARNTSRQRACLERLLDDPPEDEEAFLATMHHAAVEATYIKRCANLTLLGEAGTIDARELDLAIRESTEWLAHCGVVPDEHSWDEGKLEAGQVLRAYEDFQRAAEEALAAPYRGEGA